MAVVERGWGGLASPDIAEFYKVEPRKPAVLTAGMIGAQIPFAQTRAKHASSKKDGVGLKS